MLRASHSPSEKTARTSSSLVRTLGWGLADSQSQTLGNFALLYPVQLHVTSLLEYPGPAFLRNDHYNSSVHSWRIHVDVWQNQYNIVK